MGHIKTGGRPDLADGLWIAIPSAKSPKIMSNVKHTGGVKNNYFMIN